MQAVGLGYELIDAGDERRLERFGPVVLDRPAPMAIGPLREPAAWATPDARYEASRAGGTGTWTIHGSIPDPWLVRFGAPTIELRLTDQGQVGAFPEQAEHWSWLEDRVRERKAAGTEAVPVAVLHLFAHTGGATLASAAAGAAVVHVDAGRAVVAWARQNAARSGLADRPLRWIVDDVSAFVARETRRGRRYDGLVLDPPSYGHGPRGRTWRLVDDLDALLDACRTIISPGAFVLLTAHTPGEDGDRLADRLTASSLTGAGSIECGDLSILARSGVRLHLGAWARYAGRP